MFLQETLSVRMTRLEMRETLDLDQVRGQYPNFGFCTISCFLFSIEPYTYVLRIPFVSIENFQFDKYPKICLTNIVPLHTKSLIPINPRKASNLK